MLNADPTVFIVDDDASMRRSLQLLVESAGWRTELFACGREFLSRPRSPAPGCLVLDLHLPDLSGLDVQRIVATRTDLPVIFITGGGDVSTTVSAMKAGAVEFLTKPFASDLLLGAVRSAIDRSRRARERETEMQHLLRCYAALSPREQQVMTLVVGGRLNKQVGSELGISEITVKAHRGKVMRKMKAGSLPDLVRMAAKLSPAPVGW